MEKTTEHPIIADTSELVSLANDTDHNHNPAAEAARRLRTEKRLIIVPTAVLVETVNVLGKKSGHRVALETANEIMRPEGRFLLEEVGQYLERALEKLGQQPTGVSLTDCVVMAIADHYDTLEIFGFDKQFADAGYRRLRPSDEWKEAA